MSVPNLVSQGALNKLNITATTVLKAMPGTVLGWSVVGTAGSAAGAIYDSTSTTGNSAANQVATIPLASPATTTPVDIPCLTGIIVQPPTGGTVAVWWM